MNNIDLSQFIDIYPDFPEPGIQFRDISPILSSTTAMDVVVQQFQEKISPFKPEILAGIESRGFLFSTLLANSLGIGSIMIRKPGKLPGELLAESYSLEYGKNTLVIQKDCSAAGKRVVIIDDLLATGGTINAAIKLLQRLGATPVGVGVVIELKGLQGSTTLPIDLISLVSVDG